MMIDAPVLIFPLSGEGWPKFASVNSAAIGSDSGLSPVGTNAGLLLIEPFGTDFNEIWIKIQPFPYNKINLNHYDDVIMGTIASQITSLMIVY